MEVSNQGGESRANSTWKRAIREENPEPVLHGSEQPGISTHSQFCLEMGDPGREHRASYNWKRATRDENREPVLHGIVRPGRENPEPFQHRSIRHRAITHSQFYMEVGEPG